MNISPTYTWRRNAIPVDGKSLTIAACMCMRRRNATDRRRSLAVAAVLTVSEIFKSSCVVSLCVCASATQLDATWLTNQSNLSMVTCDSER